MLPTSPGKLIEYSKDFRNKADDIRVREKVKVEDLQEQLSKSFTNNEHVTNLEISLKESVSEVKNTDETDESNILKDANENESTIIKESAGLGVEIEENKPILLKMNYRGKPYEFTFIFDDQNRKSEWLKLNFLDKQENKYELTLNALHLFFYPFIQKRDFLVVLAKFAAALVIAELNSYEIAQDHQISPSAIRIAMGQILEDFTNER